MTLDGDPRLLDLAQRILDGVVIDWEQEMRDQPGQREALRLLRRIDHLGRSHRTATVLHSTLGPHPPDEVPDALVKWGPLSIAEKIGEGTYGEVFRAFDSRLEIDVALKLFRSDGWRTSESFLDEARSLARVRHPNVLVVYGADVHENRVGMWTELLRGTTLEQIVTGQGPMSAREAANIGVDLCRALAAVHASGFVHGDIKTANVMRENGGRIVLMDFGTALSLRGSDHGATGTPMYMSPEQFRGGPVTRESDVYSLGVLLYRLVTCRYPVEAETLVGLERRHEEGARVPLRDRRPELPGSYVRAVERAIAARPEDRFASAGALEAELNGVLLSGAGTSRFAAVRPHQKTADPGTSVAHKLWRWSGVAVALVTAVAAVLAGLNLLPAGWRTNSSPPLRVSVSLPAGLRFSGYANAAIAPDGTSIVYAASDSTGSSHLWLRRLDALQASELPESEGAFYPFWSPDSRSIAYFARGFLWTTSVGGGRTTRVCPAIAGRGGSWSADGVILFAPTTEGPLFEVPASGGNPVRATTLDSTSGELAHRWPCWLPDGRSFVYASLPAFDGRIRLYAASIHSDRRVPIGTSSSGATWGSGSLVYVDDKTLVARPFDARRLRFSGDEIPLADAQRFGGSLGEPQATASNNGVLAYQNWTRRLNQLTWVGRDGEHGAPLASGSYFDPDVSPDDERVAVERADTGMDSDIWLIAAASGSLTRVTANPGLDRFPHWSPDGARLVYASNRNGRYALFERSMSGPGAEVMLHTSPDALIKWPSDWAPDGMLSYTVFDPHTGRDVWESSGSDPGRPLLVNPWMEDEAAGSPDGEWLAYVSDEPGTPEVYCVRRSGGKAVRLSTGGGLSPRWRGDGKEVYYRSPAGMFYAVTMPPSASIQRHELFVLPHTLSYDVDSRGTRFLCVTEGASTVPAQLTVLTNWARPLPGR